MTTTANPRAGPLAVTHLNSKHIKIGQTGNEAAGGSTTTR